MQRIQQLNTLPLIPAGSFLPSLNFLPGMCPPPLPSRCSHPPAAHLECLTAYEGDDVLPQGLALHGNQVGHTATTAVLHHDPQLSAVLEAPLVEDRCGK